MMDRAIVAPIAFQAIAGFYDADRRDNGGCRRIEHRMGAVAFITLVNGMPQLSVRQSMMASMTFRVHLAWHRQSDGYTQVRSSGRYL